MRKTIILLISILTLLAMSSATCKKPLVCTGDCYDLQINGTTVSAVTGAPVGNVPLTLWRRSRGSLISTKRKIIDFQSDATGTISTNASIDTSVLRSNLYFYAELRDNPNWVIGEDNNGPLYDVTRSPFDNYRIKVYERKNLTLKLQKVSSGTFTPFTVSCYYNSISNAIAWIATEPQDIKETTKVIPMASGLWAHIDVARTNAAGNSTLTRDSVFMQSGTNQAPTYIITY